MIPDPRPGSPTVRPGGVPSTALIHELLVTPHQIYLAYAMVPLCPEM